MGFCSDKERDRFLELCPIVEKFIVDGGIQLIKVWLEVGDEEQKRRFEARTDTKHAPWHILRSDDKRRARLNCIAHLLKLIPRKKAPREKVKLPKRAMKGAYDDQASLKGRNFIAERY